MKVTSKQFENADADNFEVGIWDCCFMVTDKATGELVRNDDGSVALFNGENLDYSSFAEGLTVDNIRLRKKGGVYDVID